MNVLDLIIIGIGVLALVGGYRMGLIARVAGWVGIGVGIVVATWLLPGALREVGGGDPAIRMAVTVAAYGLALAFGGSIGEAVGYRLRHRVPPGGARELDRAFGALAGIVALLVAVWLLAPIASEVPGGVARWTRNSQIVSTVATLGPPPPQPVRDLRKLVANTRFPEVFAGIQPAPDAGAPPEELPLSEEQLAAVQSSTVGVESVACARRHEGSGWVVAGQLVVTNAHVVAGSEDLRVRLPSGGTLPASVTVFDEDRDLALLEVPQLEASPLALASAEPGSEGAGIGYPRGQDQPRAVPAQISAERTAVGRDIYGRRRSERRILIVAARLAQGDSGGPIVDPGGRVVGVTFAVAADRSATAYALDDREVNALLDAPRGEGPGPCL